MLGQFDGTARKEPQCEPLHEVQLGTKCKKRIRYLRRTKKNAKHK